MKIAVIGGGISGLAAALILDKTHEVHLYESESRLGGHAHTVSVDVDGEPRVAVDTGFLVYNTLTYPHFTRFLDYLGVESVESDMTLSIQSPGGREWAGTNLKTVFAQTQNIFSPTFWRMIRDILHFNKMADENLNLSRSRKWTLKDLVEYHGYSHAFQTEYLLPMTGSIWSMSYAKALKFPAETFLTFCKNHRLLQINNRPVWRTIKDGSVNYVDRVQKHLRHIHLASPIDKVVEAKGKLVLYCRGADVGMEFDKVIFATHAPITRQMIQSSFPDMAEELLPMQVTSNTVKLHQDESVMPKNKICWSAWNVQAKESPNASEDIGLTYYINKLQPLKTKNNFFVTLNSKHNLDQVRREFVYDHPQFDFSAIELQARLPALQGRHNLYFAGAWTRYGFHEDGIASAVEVAKKMGVNPPWG